MLLALLTVMVLGVAVVVAFVVSTVQSTVSTAKASVNRLRYEAPRLKEAARQGATQGTAYFAMAEDRVRHVTHKPKRLPASTSR